MVACCGTCWEPGETVAGVCPGLGLDCVSCTGATVWLHRLLSAAQASLDWRPWLNRVPAAAHTSRLGPQWWISSAAQVSGVRSWGCGWARETRSGLPLAQVEEADLLLGGSVRLAGMVLFCHEAVWLQAA